ncbi:MAG: helix-turn-helix domain-containing protein, partial [Salinirussus sp.]
MAVIAHLNLPSVSFELGRILELESKTVIELENLVPLGEHAVPFFSVSESVRDSFEQSVRDHPSVMSIGEVSRHADKILYSLEWDVSRDVFFAGIIEADGHILSAIGKAQQWEFEIRFPTHEALSQFQEYCINAHIDLDIGRIYNPAKPGSGMWYGLTPAQRTALTLAVEEGYYSIPRDISTKGLADRLGISDQAVTERLR